MASRVHLVRHGEVHNPGHIVYASLPGYSLSPEGEGQARAAARYLARQPLVAVWSSPLERALRTAEIVATRAGLPVQVDSQLSEWRMLDRWAGSSWDDLADRFPGELEAYLDDPTHLPFSPESLAQLADRMSGTVRAIEERYPHGDVVVVSHSAPLRAASLGLTGAPLAEYWKVKPGHCGVTTMRPGRRWEIEAVWEPDLP